MLGQSYTRILKKKNVKNNGKLINTGLSTWIIIYDFGHNCTISDPRIGWAWKYYDVLRESD